ncbi:MAG: HAMP domain-containing histidine kinase [Chitinophagaceae bacterium]|nr:HAMP domain-containing histidine kinase [Chitinophagaceae bacterium]MCW5929521.1 HAMP domain-containing histidine kinase [Chitinophagaceae bacterium]
MKLLQQSLRYNIIITVISLTVAGIFMYYLLKKEIIAEIREQLEYQAEEIHQSLERGHSVSYPLVEIEKVDNSIGAYSIFRDTLIYDPLQDKSEDYYYLLSVKKNNAGNYRIRVMTTYIGWNEYSSTIFTMLFFTALLLTLLNVMASYFFNKKIWSPFFYNLDKLKKFSVSSEEPISLQSSKVIEFKELQESLQDLADRSQKEYKALREFTENASHEMQTPLGIIQSKLDRMSQAELNEEIAGHIVQAKSGVERLKKLNKSLLLLAKLDNNAYPDKTEISLDTLLKRQLELLEELLAGNETAAIVNIAPVHIHANLFLTEVMLSNLLSNAIRYTAPGNNINIFLSGNKFRITNPGAPLDFPEDFLFQRFRKSPQNIQATGLGLSIVYRICQLNNWKVAYEYREGHHSFSIIF